MHKIQEQTLYLLDIYPQAELARLVLVTPGTIRNWSRGKMTRPHLATSNLLTALYKSEKKRRG